MASMASIYNRRQDNVGGGKTWVHELRSFTVRNQNAYFGASLFPLNAKCPTWSRNLKRTLLPIHIPYLVGAFWINLAISE